MANNFQITISALDKATSVVRKVNNEVSKIVRPITNVKRASVSLGKELGIGRVATQMRKVAKAAVGVGEAVSKIVAPIAAIAGVGSIAAIGELAKKWGDLGAEISRTSQTIGISTSDLQTLRGAAQLSGLSAESLTSGLKSLGDTMEDALYGRNQSALMLMNQLGIKMKHTAGGAVDTAAAFSDLAQSIYHIKNPQVQGLVARTFGLEALLPLLRKGKAGIAELTEQMRRSGAIMGGPALAAATAFQQSMAFMDIALNSLKNTIGAALLPVLQPFVESITKWTLANKDLIATRFAEFADGVASAIKSIDWNEVVNGAKSIVQGIRDVVDWLGGWKNAAVVLLVMINGPLIAGIFNLGIALAGLGATMLATPIGWLIAGIAGIAVAGYELVKHWNDIKHWWHNLWGGMADDAENGASRISQGQIQLKGGHGASGSWGGGGNLLGMVRKLEGSGDSAISKAGAIGRYQIMPDTAKQYGFDPSRLKDPAYNTTVAGAVLADLQKKYGNDTDAILSAYNAGPGRANQFIESGRNVAVLPQETQNYLNHAHQMMGGQGGNGGQGGSGAVTVEISFANAPPGMKTHLASSGNVMANVKIAHAMPGVGS